ncbi:hypothetical protein AB4K20DRAFT_1962605 [Rhizopus microsporus]
MPNLRVFQYLWKKYVYAYYCTFLSFTVYYSLFIHSLLLHQHIHTHKYPLTTFSCLLESVYYIPVRFFPIYTLIL